jgi:hypothetical protein
MSVVGLLKEVEDTIKANLRSLAASSGFHYGLSAHNTVTNQTRDYETH